MEGADAVAGRDTTAPDYRAMVAEVQTATTDVAEADPPGSQVVGAQYRSQVAGTADRARTRRDRDSVADYEHPQSQQAKRERLHVEETPRAGVEICVYSYISLANKLISLVCIPVAREPGNIRR